MLGFPGHFSVNFEIPDYWQIGGLVLNLIQDRCRGGLGRFKELKVERGKIEFVGKEKGDQRRVRWPL